MDAGELVSIASLNPASRRTTGNKFVYAFSIVARGRKGAHDASSSVILRKSAPPPRRVKQLTQAQKRLMAHFSLRICSEIHPTGVSKVIHVQIAKLIPGRLFPPYERLTKT